MNNQIYEYLHETRKNLLEEIEGMSDSQINRKTTSNLWSIAQICHHLVLVEEATVKAIAWGMKASERKQMERKEIKSILLDRSRKLKAPEIVEPSEGPFTVQQLITLLNDSRKKLMALLSTMNDTDVLAEKSVKHPALGEISLIQWIEQIYLHEQRHLEQIKELPI